MHPFTSLDVVSFSSLKISATFKVLFHKSNVWVWTSSEEELLLTNVPCVYGP